MSERKSNGISFERESFPLPGDLGNWTKMEADVDTSRTHFTGARHRPEPSRYRMDLIRASSDPPKMDDMSDPG